MAAVGEPRENGFAERLMRTIKEAATTTPSRYSCNRDAYNRPGAGLRRALLELARWCQARLASHGGTAPCPDPRLPQSPPPLTIPRPPPAPVWAELPLPRREELLRILGRMLAERLGRGGAPAREATHDRH